MRVASFTQTYGNDRILEIILLKYDRLGTLFRNKCDKIVFSFHNCGGEFINNAKQQIEQIFPKDKLLFLYYDDLSYRQTVQRTLKVLKSENIDYVLQIQDDQFGLNSKDNLRQIGQYVDEIFEFVTLNKPEYLHIFGSEGDPIVNKLGFIDKITLTLINYYKYDSRDFKKSNIYSWNDGTYFGEIDFLIKLFDIDNLPEDVWNLEIYLKELFDSNKYYRWGIDKTLFKACNIHGRNRNTSPLLDNLKRFFGDLDEWETRIKTDISNYI